MKPGVVFSSGDQQLIYFKNFADSSWYKALLSEIDWKQNSIRLFGKVHNEPRLNAWFGKPYSYSGIDWPRQDLIALLEAIRKKLSLQFSFDFNSCLCNFYRDGNDSIGWHSDDEQEMDQSLVASLSFGEPRIFKIRN